MKNILYIILIFSFSFTIISCAKKSGGSSGSSSSDTNGSGGGSSYSSSCNNSKAFVIGNAVTEKCSRTDCPKSKIVIWDLDGCMTVVGESILGAVDAASHNNSIYIADDAGFYWIVGADNNIEKKQINYPSGYKNSEITGISVNSIGDVYVAGMVVKNKKDYTAYWKNGELVKTFSENADWYSEKHVAADSNGNVYIPGYRMKSHEVTYSALWVNGTRKNLSTSHDGEATDAVIGSETTSGANVWVSGAHGPYTQGGTLAAYWRRNPNGQSNQTKVTKVRTYNSPKNWVYSSRASSIFIGGSIV